MQAESLEAKTATENAATAAKKEMETAKVLVSKKTGKPLYTPQPLRSSACLYKEARMNNVSYDKLLRTNTDTVASSSGAFTTIGDISGFPISGNTFSTVLMSLLAVGGFVEGLILFSQTSASPSPSLSSSSSSSLAYSHRQLSADVGRVKSLNDTGYSLSTIKLIKDTLNEQSKRRSSSRI